MPKNDFDAFHYLTNVLGNWDEFCRSHKNFALAIKILLEENKHLKEYNQILQELLLTEE